jgi:hypothetical protein
MDDYTLVVTEVELTRYRPPCVARAAGRFCLRG